MRSLKNKFIIFAIVTVFFTTFFSLFMYSLITNIDDKIREYKTKAVDGKVLILTIEKDLNYISRCSRDLMLGNDYRENLSKISQRSESIEKNFILLKQTIVNDKDYKKNIELFEKTEKKSLYFVHGVQKMMNDLKGDLDSSRDIYLRYKKTLTPPAVQSRIHFNEIKQIMDNYFIKISNDLEENITSNKKLIIIVNMVVIIIILFTFIFIYRIRKKQQITKNKNDRLNHILSKYVIYSKTDLKGRITEVSDAFCKISKFDKNELLGRPHNIVRHPDMSSEDFKSMWNVIQRNEVWQGEIENLTKDGSSYWVDVIISPDYDDCGNKIGYIAVRHDITANKKIAIQTMQLMQSEKMASLGEMIGNIAHQWRQPLSVISTAASGLRVKKEYGILEDEFLDKTLSEIIKSTQYLSKTIDTFRNFIKEKKEVKNVNLQETIEGAINIISSSLKDNHIALRNKIDNTDAINYSFIPGEFIQVVINIINNAKDVLLERGISNPWIEISFQQDPENIIITIEDNGGGIPEEILHKIFEPYFTTKHKSQGTGLGLHMSYRIITESFNGELYAQNTQNGAKFFISLPLQS